MKGSYRVAKTATDSAPRCQVENVRTQNAHADRRWTKGLAAAQNGTERNGTSGATGWTSRQPGARPPLRRSPSRVPNDMWIYRGPRLRSCAQGCDRSE